MGQIEKFYRDIKQMRRESTPSGTTLDANAITGLMAELRGYQHRGVEWMLGREGKLNQEEEEACGPRPLHMLWKELPTIEHGLPYAVYFNIHGGK